MGYLDSIEQPPNFKVGDKVVCKYSHDTGGLSEGTLYTVSDIEYDIDEDAWYISVEELAFISGCCEWYASRFEKAN